MGEISRHCDQPPARCVDRLRPLVRPHPRHAPPRLQPREGDGAFHGRMDHPLLVLTLMVSPVIKVTGWGWLIRYRRIFGLIAFFYIFCHLTIYFVLDAELNWSLLVEDVSDRLYITLGMAGFLLLVPLAITSTKGWIKRLGNKRWNALHWLIFPAVLLGMIHYYMAVKRDIREPLFYALIFAALFWYRLNGREKRNA